MATKKKKRNTTIPDVPESQQIGISDLYKPMNADQIMDLWSRMMVGQQEWMTAERRNQVELQTDLFRNMSALQREQGPLTAMAAWQMMHEQLPRYRAEYEMLGNNLINQLAQGPPPEFMATYGALGARINQGLEAGYTLGPDLAAEVEQGIRAGQTARGNYLGPALTAEEAFGRGQAALNLYNQRLGQAQTYLQGQNPTDVRTKLTGQMQNYLQGRNPADVTGQIAGTYLGQSYYPNYAQLNTGLGVQAAQVLNTGTQDYNRNYISAFNANNEAQYNNYDRNFEQFLYNQAVQHGLYSMPGAMGGGGGIGGLIGGIGSAAGGILGGLGAAGGSAGIGGAVAGIGGALAAF